MMFSICILLRVRTRFRTSALWGHYTAVMEGYFFRFSPVSREILKQETQDQERLAFTHPKALRKNVENRMEEKKGAKKKGHQEI